MTPEQRVNCEKLLEFFEAKATDRQCNMTVWAKNGDFIPAQETGRRGTPECGTVACLAGWGALLCAPTIDAGQRAWGGSSVLHDIRVPLEWADQHVVHSYHYSRQSDPTSVSISAVGEAVLGKELAKWFGWQDGPSECNMSDRQWMAAVLRKELGMPYDERLDSATPLFDREP